MALVTNDVSAATMICVAVWCFSIQRKIHRTLSASFLDFGTIIHDYGTIVKGFLKTFLTMVRFYDIVTPRMEVMP